MKTLLTIQNEINGSDLWLVVSENLMEVKIVSSGKMA